MLNVLDQCHGDGWAMYNADSVRAIRGVPDASVGLSVYSPPFSNLYIYSSSIADMGNSQDHAEFFEHYAYVARELLRVTKPGRLAVVHCKDMPLYKGRDGAMGLYEFPDELVRVHRAAGWTYHSRVTIWKDPVTEMQRTKNHGLLYKELCKDSCGSRQGMADYLVVFRKWGEEFADPVTVGGERFDRYVGTDPPDCDRNIWASDGDGFRVRPDGYREVRPTNGRWPSHNPFEPGTDAYRAWSIAVWQRYASPVWMDIDQMDVLNGKVVRTGADERHICPLQVGLAERCVHLWSNPGDVVFTPFGGIGTEVYAAVKNGRKGVGIELKPEYYRHACKFLGDLEAEMSRPTLFDRIECGAGS